MLLLCSTSDLVQVVTSAVSDIEVHASWLDVTGTPQVVTPGRTNTPSITTATTTTVVGSPAASTQRNVKALYITNNHATDPCFVEVRHTDGTNVSELAGVTLLAGENLILDAAGNWRHKDANGAEYANQSGSPLVVKSLLADQSNSTVTPTEVTGLTLAVGPGTYAFDYYIRYQAAAATTGIRLDVNHTGTVTAFIWNQYWVGSLNTTSSDAPDQDMIAALGGVMSAFASRAKGTAGRGTTLSVDTAGGDMLMRIEGMMIVTVAGNLALWHGSEVAAASTIKAGTSLVLIKTG
jgi:hypothetical protein